MTQIETGTTKLAPETRLGAVELTVTDLDRSVSFYEDAIGLRTHGRGEGRAALGAGNEDLLVLVEDPDAGSAGRHAGLYHFALLHPSRQELARAFGATDIVTERGADGVAKIRELTAGLGAHSVVEAVGSQEAMMQAIRSTRPGGHVGFVGVSHGVEISGIELFFSEVHLHGGPAPVRRYLPELIALIRGGRIDPGKVFDLTLPLAEVAEGYRAMDERRAIKTLLTV